MPTTDYFPVNDRPGLRRARRRGTSSLLVVLAGAALAALMALASGCGSSTSSSSGTTPAAPGTSIVGLQRTPPLEVAGVSLPEVTTGSDGAPMTLKAEPGKLLAVYFGYTNCPDLCPTTMADLKIAKRKLDADGDKLDVAFVTVDPQRDTPELLNKYMGSFFDHFHALRTEDTGALRTAEDAFLASSSLTPNADGTYEVNHTATTAVVDDQGQVLLEWPFGTSPDVMADDLRILFAQMPPTSSTSSPSTTKGPNP